MLGRGIPFPPFFKLKGHPPIATGNRCPGLDYAAGIRDVGVDRGLSHRQEHSRFPLPIVPGLTSKTCVQGRWCLVRKLLFSAFSAFFCFCSFYFLLPAVIFLSPVQNPFTISWRGSRPYASSQQFQPRLYHLFREREWGGGETRSRNVGPRRRR